jgi:hypothetical protein
MYDLLEWSGREDLNPRFPSAGSLCRAGSWNPGTSGLSKTSGSDIDPVRRSRRLQRSEVDLAEETS